MRRIAWRDAKTITKQKSPAPTSAGSSPSRQSPAPTSAGSSPDLPAGSALVAVRHGAKNLTRLEQPETRKKEADETDVEIYIGNGPETKSRRGGTNGLMYYGEVDIEVLNPKKGEELSSSHLVTIRQLKILQAASFVQLKAFSSFGGAKVFAMKPFSKNGEPMLPGILKLNKAKAVIKELEEMKHAKKVFCEFAPEAMESSPNLYQMKDDDVAGMVLEITGSRWCMPNLVDACMVTELGNIFDNVVKAGGSDEKLQIDALDSVQYLFKIIMPKCNTERATLQEIDLWDQFNIQNIIEVRVLGDMTKTKFGSDYYDGEMERWQNNLRQRRDGDKVPEKFGRTVTDEEGPSAMTAIISELTGSALTPSTFFQEFLAFSRSMSPQSPQTSSFSITKGFKCMSYMGDIHGDLHMGNVIKDTEGQLWVIDFDTMREGGHVFFDLSKFLAAGLFLHGPVDSSEEVSHMRSLVMLLATVPSLERHRSLPSAPPTASSSVCFFWNFAGLMLKFFHDYSCCKPEKMNHCEMQFAWSFLYWSLQMVTYAQNRKSPKRKQLALYTAVALAVRIRADQDRNWVTHVPHWVDWISKCHSQWQSGWSDETDDSIKTETMVKRDRRERYLCLLGPRVAWARDPFTRVPYSVLHDAVDLKASIPGQKNAESITSIADVFQFMQQHKRAVVLGPPGSGKTIQTRQLVAYAAEQQLGLKHQHPNLLPLRLPLVELKRLASATLELEEECKSFGELATELEEENKLNTLKAELERATSSHEHAKSKLPEAQKKLEEAQNKENHKKEKLREALKVKEKKIEPAKKADKIFEELKKKIEAAEKAQAEVLSVSMTLNVDDQQLAADDKVNLKGKIGDVLAESASRTEFVDQSAVSVTLTPGSVKVDAKIQTPDAKSLEKSTNPDNIAKNVAEAANSIPGVKAAATGELKVTDLEIKAVDKDIETLKVNLKQQARQSAINAIENEESNGFLQILKFVPRSTVDENGLMVSKILGKMILGQAPSATDLQNMTEALNGGRQVPAELMELVAEGLGSGGLSKLMALAQKEMQSFDELQGEVEQQAGEASGDVEEAKELATQRLACRAENAKKILKVCEKSAEALSKGENPLDEVLNVAAGLAEMKPLPDGLVNSPLAGIVAKLRSWLKAVIGTAKDTKVPPTIPPLIRLLMLIRAQLNSQSSQADLDPVVFGDTTMELVRVLLPQNEESEAIVTLFKAVTVLGKFVTSGRPMRECKPMLDDLLGCVLTGYDDPNLVNTVKFSADFAFAKDSFERMALVAKMLEGQIGQSSKETASLLKMLHRCGTLAFEALQREDPNPEDAAALLSKLVVQLAEMVIEKTGAKSKEVGFILQFVNALATCSDGESSEDLILMFKNIMMEEAKKLLIQQASQLMRPELENLGVDTLTAVKVLDTVTEEDLKGVMNGHVSPVLTKVQDYALENAKPFLIKKMALVLTPELTSRGIDPEGAKQILTEFATEDVLKPAMKGDMKPMLAMLDELAKTKGREWLSAKAAGVLKPQLSQYGVDVNTIKKVLDQVDEDDVQKAMQGDAKYLKYVVQKVKDFVKKEAQKFLSIQAMKILKPELLKRKIDPDVAKILFQQISKADLVAAVQGNISLLLARVQDVMLNEGRIWAILNIVALLEPRFEQLGLNASIVEDALMTIGEDELKAALSGEYEGLLRRMKDYARSEGKKYLIVKVAPMLETELKQQGLDVESAKKCLDIVEESDLHAVMAGNTKPIMRSLQDYAKTNAKAWAAAQVSAVLEPELQNLGLDTDAARSILEEVTEEDLQAAMKGQPQKVLDKLKTVALEQTRQFLASQVVMHLGVPLKKAGISPAAAKKVIETMDVADLQAIISEATDGGSAQRAKAMQALKDFIANNAKKWLATQVIAHEMIEREIVRLGIDVKAAKSVIESISNDELKAALSGNTAPIVETLKKKAQSQGKRWMVAQACQLLEKQLNDIGIDIEVARQVFMMLGEKQIKAALNGNPEPLMAEVKQIGMERARPWIEAEVAKILEPRIVAAGLDPGVIRKVLRNVGEEELKAAQSGDITPLMRRFQDMAANQGKRWLVSQATPLLQSLLAEHPQFKGITPEMTKEVLQIMNEKHIRLALANPPNTQPLLERVESYIKTQGKDFLSKQIVSTMGPTLKELGLSPKTAIIALKDVPWEDLQQIYESGDLQPIIDRFKDYAWVQTQSFLLDQLVERLAPELAKATGMKCDLGALKVVLKESLSKDEMNQALGDGCTLMMKKIGEYTKKHAREWLAIQVVSMLMPVLGHAGIDIDEHAARATMMQWEEEKLTDILKGGPTRQAAIDKLKNTIEMQGRSFLAAQVAAALPDVVSEELGIDKDQIKEILQEMEQEDLEAAIGGNKEAVLVKLQQEAEKRGIKGANGEADGKGSKSGLQGMIPEDVQKTVKLAMDVGKDLMALKSGVELKKLENSISSSSSPAESVLPTVMTWLKAKVGDDVFPLLNLVFSMLVSAVSYGMQKLKKPDILKLVQTVVPEMGTRMGAPEWASTGMVQMIKASETEVSKSQQVQVLMKLCLHMVSGQVDIKGWSRFEQLIVVSVPLLIEKGEYECKRALREVGIQAGQIFGAPKGTVPGALAIMDGDFEGAVKHVQPLIGKKVKLEGLVEVSKKCREMFQGMNSQAMEKKEAADKETAELMKKIGEGKAASDELFKLVDSQGDNNGTISKEEYGKLMKRLGQSLTQHHVNEIFSAVKQKTGTGAKSKNQELNRKEFKLALEYLQARTADGALHQLGLSSTQLGAMVFILTSLLVLLFVFIFLGITALALGGAFGAVINSSLPVASGTALGSKKPAVSDSPGERESQLAKGLEDAEASMEAT
eukprot:gnl/MRDRNA2_/MRDRNA2_82243_c0_seq1.p1 gnl/MRDRNA2_/MRDRNA2_82243_c0~~gnl/MRDRNA2_/MRDRNA2_82243_c0_seq1.p1  ORF type:complete len:2838 (+),score=733.91 gnl/MRDRNA2_/MRDRNA2_82243_c0_seq1:183-8696(+)